MKKIFIGLLSCALMLFSSKGVVAQDDFSGFIRYADDIDESERLLEAYAGPFMKGVTQGLTGGWYNTAKSHKMVGFDITTSVSFLSIPDEEMFFNVEKMGLTKFDLANTADGDLLTSPEYPNAPTVFGSEKTPKFVHIDDNGVRSEPFSGPSGLDIKENMKVQKLPVPMVNVGMSLPKGTDLKVRFAPTIDIGDDGEFNFWGVGVMHDVKQYIPGIKMMPFDLSAFVGHTQMEVVYRDTFEETPGENQRAEMKFSATTIQGVISKKISVLTLYGGVGYNIAKSSMGIKGTYEVDDDGVLTTLADPVSLDFTASSARLTGGFRLKLAVFTLHADYTLQKYDCINVGVGISVR